MPRSRNEVVAPAPQAVENVQKNFFAIYGEQATQRSGIVGSLLKFSKGDWLLGQEEQEIPLGTRYVCSMENFLVGWVKWVDNKPVELKFGRLVDGHKPPTRFELGDNDKTQWEVGSDGKERDPWQFTNQVLMKPVGKKYSTDIAITFATNSKGGIGGMGALCKEYAADRTHDGMNPIVELGVSGYNHSNKEFGKIKTPVLKLVDWEKGSLFDTNVEDEEETPKPKLAVGGKRR